MELSYGSKWILPTNFQKEKDCYIEFIDSFSLDQVNDIVQMRLSAFNQCTLWINGKFAFVSSFTNYPSCNFYDTIDITDFVKSGKNILRITCYCSKTSNTTFNPDSAGVIFDIFSNKNCLLVSSSATLSRIVTEYKNTRNLLFSYDASSNNDSGNYYNSNVTTNKCNILPRPLNNILSGKRITSKIIADGIYLYNPLNKECSKPKRLKNSFTTTLNSSFFARNVNDLLLYDKNKKPVSFRVTTDEMNVSANGTFITFDLSKEQTGFIEIDITAAKDTIIYITSSSKLSGNISDFDINKVGKYLCNTSRNKFIFFFHKTTCRYITIFIESFDFDVHYVGLRPCIYPFAQKGYFSSSDSIHNKIYSNCMDVLCTNMSHLFDKTFSAANSFEFLIDNTLCPSMYYTYGNYEYSKEALKATTLLMNEDGFISCGAYLSEKIVPSFSLIWIIKWYDYVFNSGDVLFARDMWKYAETIIRTFWRNAKGRDLQYPFSEDCYVNYYEGTKGLNKGFPKEMRNKNDSNNFDGILTIFYILALKSIINAAKFIYSHTEDFQKSTKQYENIDFVEKISWCEMLLNGAINNFHNAFWDTETGAYCAYVVNGDKVYFCEFMNALALYAGLVPDKLQKHIADILSDKEKVFPELIPMSLNNTIYKYESLLKFDPSYGEYVLNHISSIWGENLFENGKFDDTLGITTPLIIYFKYVLGISPKLYGFSDYYFKPLKVKSLLPVSGKIPRPGRASLDILIDKDRFKIT